MKLLSGLGNLKNRVAMAPMTRGRATEQHVPTAIMVDYYAERADCGLLITEGAGITQENLGWYRAPGIWSKEQVEAWKPVTKKVHERGGTIFMQLWAMGRAASQNVTKQELVSASAVTYPGEMTGEKGEKHEPGTPRALGLDEIPRVVKEFQTAAANAMEAGFDGVEIHGANGYLVDQFLQSCTNKRTDQYGGSIENRLRFMQEVVESILEVVPAEKLAIRFAPNGAFGGMGSADNVETFDAAIEWVAKKNLRFIHLMDGLGFGFHKLCEPYTLERARGIINNVGSSSWLMGNVGYDVETAERAIENGHADLIAFGRPYMSNPDLVARIQNNEKLEDSPPYPHWWQWDLNEEGYLTYERLPQNAFQ